MTNKKDVVSSKRKLVDAASFLRPAWGARITEAEMDATKRKITKIAREVSKFIVRTMRAEGIGAGEFDVLHT